MNRLYFGDNLKWLSDRKEFPDESVDLVYLDPPFNSNADYNVLFREPSGQVSQAQFHAFTDTWSWADAADTYHRFIDTCPKRRSRRVDGSAPQLPQTLTDDGSATRRTSSHSKINRQ